MKENDKITFLDSTERSTQFGNKYSIYGQIDGITRLRIQLFKIFELNQRFWYTLRIRRQTRRRIFWFGRALKVSHHNSNH